MLELYDKNHALAGHLFDYESLKTESEAATGDSTLSFTYLGDKTLKAEMYIRDGDAEYVIKEVSEKGGDFPEVVAALNLEGLQREMWQTFSVTDVTIDEAARTVLAGTGWTVGECTVTKKRNAGMMQVSSLEVIQKLCTAFMCEPVFDTINKTVSFYAERGEDKGVYFLQGLNMKAMQKDSTSYDYYTRIIPIGENGLTIADVNDGKTYLENFQYSDKLLTYLWKDESYTDAQALMEDAELKLEDLSKPSVSYTAEIRNLAAQKPEYSILSYGLGDTVWVIDRETGTREKQRIVKLTRYPDDPEKDTCELSSTVPTFETMQEKYNAAMEIINFTVTGDGRYTGTISVSDILNFETGLSTSGTISGINSSLTTLEGELGAVRLSVGSLEANCLKTEDAELKYAHIDLSNIEQGCITTAMIGTGVVGTAQIADGSITDAKIVDLTANKITAGILSVERLEIRGSTNSIVYELNNITGALQAQNVDTLNGEILTQRSITADKIVANAITSNEIAAKTITANEIAANTITAAKIAAGTITANEIAAKTITANEIDVTDLFAQDITASGTITGVTINGGTINGGTINSATLNSTTGNIGGFTISSAALYSGTTSLGGAPNSVYLGTDGISCGDRFIVTNDGSVKIIDDQQKVCLKVTDQDSEYCYSELTSGKLSMETALYKVNLSNDILEIQHSGSKQFVVDLENSLVSLLINRAGIQMNMLGSGRVNFIGTSFEFDGVIYEDGTLLSDKYLPLSGGTVSGTVDFWGNVGFHGTYTTFVYAPYITNIDTVTSGNYLTLSSSGKISYLSSSSERYKDIGSKVAETDIEALYSAKVVWGKYKDGYLLADDERYGKFMPMLIAEDIDSKFPLAVDHKNGLAENWNERIMIPAMLCMLQSQKMELGNHANSVKSIEARNEALQAQLNEAFDRIAELEKLINAA